ncbi:hypothetical protein [Comamonas antarctica]|uniref:Uncharacterized protein n=1 Tax=Comamonas antarctica TaxID=2743470 RepID=A0A6N1WXW9_9BURK|nr:hypothetical protein [Comamonas antarctica]QKV51817.1 hypothetical protein HUK68_02260 [Comamonas antarctica]
MDWRLRFTANCGGNGRFHHLIALFSTVAAKRCEASGGVTIICNEINDLDQWRIGVLGKTRCPISTYSIQCM